MEWRPSRIALSIGPAMSHRLMAEIADLEHLIHEMDQAIIAAMLASVADIVLIRDRQKRRDELIAWLDMAREAMAR